MENSEIYKTVNFTPEVLNEYANRFDTKYKANTSAEETFYTAFQLLLEGYFQKKNGFIVQTNGREEDTKSRPDFIIYLDNLKVLIVESKTPGSPIVEWLTSYEKNRLKDQIIRYRKDFGYQIPFIITDFISVFLLEIPANDSNEELSEIKIKRSVNILEKIKGQWQFSHENSPQLEMIFQSTSKEVIISIESIKNMIKELAVYARNLKNAIYDIYTKNKQFLTDSISLSLLSGQNKLDTNAKSNISMISFLQTIKDDLNKTIFSDSKENTDMLFSDIITQTIVYGCFGAWLKFCGEGHNSNDFSIQIVGHYLPYGTFIRQLFMDTTGKLTPLIEEEYISQIERVFKSSRFQKIVDKTENLMTMFYSEFLKQYDKDIAKARGVVFTPSEIVDYMVKGIDYFLEKKFHKSMGVINTDFYRGEHQSANFSQISNQNSIEQNKISIEQNKISIEQNKISIEKENFPVKQTESKIAVNFLEPAAGTMAFPCGLLKFAKQKFDIYHGNQPILAETEFEEWVERFFFKNVYAFEILMAPYVLGYIRTYMTIQELLHQKNLDKFGSISDPESIYNNLQLYIMNTLMNSENIDQYISDENIKRQIKGGLEVRDRKKIYIIFGNPPYNVSTQNDSQWIRTLIEDYKKGLNEKNLKILSDDYVKFIRFAQWKIKHTRLGMVAFITNNNYLDGSVFKIMRKSLMETFNEIYIVNLHGNMRKNETGNPFNIKVGVSIVFLLRTDENYKPKIKDIDVASINIGKTSKKNKDDKIIKFDEMGFHLDKEENLSKTNKKPKIHKANPFQNLNFGCTVKYLDIPAEKLEDKYWELSKPFDEIQFETVPMTPQYYFIPKNIDKEIRYYNFIPITQLFKETPKSGIMAGRDALVSNPDKNILIENINLFFDQKFEQLEKLGVTIKKTKSWDPKKALEKSNKTAAINSITKYNYRGMDTRYFVYDNALVEGCRLGYLDLISEDNPAISVTRSIRTEHFSHALITSHPPEKCFLAVKDSSYVFTLKTKTSVKLSSSKESGLQYNMNIPELGFEIDAESVFYYIYAILYSSTYRKNYNSQLKRQYPRIPFPNSINKEYNKEIFEEMSDLGKNLAEIHLGKSNLINTSELMTGKTGNLKIMSPIFKESEEKVYFNDPDKLPSKTEEITWIGGISKNIWDFEIGSIKQLEKWLNARKYVDPTKENIQKKKKRHKGLRRPLNSDELKEFLELCSIIKLTIEILPKINEIYQKIDTE